MAEKMIKILMFTYGERVPNPLYDEEHEDGQPETVIKEGLGRLGQVVDITRQYDLARGEELDAFYTDAERKAIEDGTYEGDDAEIVQSAIANTDTGTPTITAVPGATGGVQEIGGESYNISDMSDEEVSDMIAEKKLTVDETIALAGDDPDQINKVMDAENLLKNGPRTGVLNALDKKLADADSGENEDD